VKLNSDQKLDLDVIKNETVVYLNPGESVLVEAETNPSTGFSWQKDIPENCAVKLQSENKKEIYSDNRVGAPLTEQTIFKGMKKGTCTVLFNYARSWEADQSTAKKITFIVK